MLVPVDIVVLKEPFKPVSSDVKCGLDNRFGRCVANCLDIGTLTQYE